MAKRFNAARLFEPWKFRRDPKLEAYRSDEAGLDAVRARKKGMSMFSTVAGEVAAPGFAEWMKLAFDRDLVLVLQDNPLPGWKLERRPITMFISRPDELWRIPAYQALWKTAFADGRWSDAAENQMSYLLGYTGEQRKRWIEYQRQQRAAWTCATVYALLTADRRNAIEALGKRCFGAADSVAGMTLFWHRGDELKRNAFADVPPGSTLARAGLRWKQFHQVFGELQDMRKRGLIEREVTAKLAPVINGGLVSNVQFLTRKGWV